MNDAIESSFAGRPTNHATPAPTSSGSGKTTLLHLLAGLDTPTAGCVRFEGEDIHRRGERGLVAFRRQHCALVFQSLNLLASMTAEENVRLPLALRGVAAR